MNPPTYIPEQDETQSYKQQLGLKKMLYKYQYQNQQLRAQIKALTQRLSQILQKKAQQNKQQQKPHLTPPQQFRLNLLKQQMKKLFNEIQRANVQIKQTKQQINQFQQLKCQQLTNNIKKQQKQIQKYKNQLKQFQKMQRFKGYASQMKDIKHSTIRISTHTDKLKQLQETLKATLKSVRQLQKLRDSYDRTQIKRHNYIVKLNNISRKVANKETQGQGKVEHKQKKEKGIWHMDYSQQNYQKIRQQLTTLKQQKHRTIQSLKNQNIVLKNRFTQLSLQSQQLNKSIHLPMIQPKTDRIRKSQAKQAVNQSMKVSRTISPPPSPPKLLQVGPKEFQRGNDKNFVPKKLRKVQWQSNQFRYSGIQWNDAHLRSPITGINFWIDPHLIGLQLLHKTGQSSQHLHLTSKSTSPIQYRLNGNDYLQNIILWISSDNKISGIQLVSHGGRKDGFGNRGKGRKFDFGIREPEKPVYSFGKFRIVDNVSDITKLGFEVI